MVNTLGTSCQDLILVTSGLRSSLDLVSQFNYNGNIIADREDQMQNPKQVSVYNAIDKVLAVYGVASAVALAAAARMVVGVYV